MAKINTRASIPITISQKAIHTFVLPVLGTEPVILHSTLPLLPGRSLHTMVRSLTPSQTDVDPQAVAGVIGGIPSKITLNKETGATLDSVSLFYHSSGVHLIVYLYVNW